MILPPAEGEADKAVADPLPDAPETVAPDATPEPDPAMPPETDETPATDDAGREMVLDEPEASPGPASAETTGRDALVPPPPPPAPIKHVTVQKVGFLPLVLGGAIAAGFGFLLAYFYYGQDPNDYQGMIAAEAARIDALEAAAAPVADLGPVTERIDALAADLDGRLSALGADLAAFDDRLTAVERAPSGDGTLSETAIASWQEELDAIRAEFASRQAEMQALADNAQAELRAVQDEAAANLAAAAAEAEAVEEAAEDAASSAIARAAIARVQAALDSGAPFEAALADLGTAGIEAPAALSAVAAEGAPTILALREAFPEAARNALAAARSEGLADGDSNPITAFLRNQFEVRSVTPRDGDDPDAILSRAEAALADNRLTDALAEVETLPEVVRAEMAGWITLARGRSDALAAVESLDQTLSN